MGATMTFSKAVKCGNRLNDWNTMPTWDRSASIRWSESITDFPSRVNR